MCVYVYVYVYHSIIIYEMIVCDGDNSVCCLCCVSLMVVIHCVSVWSCEILYVHLILSVGTMLDTVMVCSLDPFRSDHVGYCDGVFT